MGVVRRFFHPPLFLLLLSCGFSAAAETNSAPPLELRDLTGQERVLRNFQDKLTLVHFWATWCKPCRVELPALLEVAQDLQHKGLKLVMVAADNRDAVAAYLTKHSLDMPVLIDQYGTALRDYKIRGLPATVMIGNDGEIQQTRHGSVEWESASIINMLTEALGK